MSALTIERTIRIKKIITKIIRKYEKACERRETQGKRQYSPRLVLKIVCLFAQRFNLRSRAAHNLQNFFELQGADTKDETIDYLLRLMYLTPTKYPLPKRISRHNRAKLRPRYYARVLRNEISLNDFLTMFS